MADMSLRERYQVEYRREGKSNRWSAKTKRKWDLDGTWGEGAVYEGYDTALHVVDKFSIPEEWPRMWVVDFGYTNPLCFQAWASDPDGRLYRYHEIYKTMNALQRGPEIVAADNRRRSIAQGTSQGLL